MKSTLKSAQRLPNLKITKISVAVKNSSRINIFVDDEFSFSLTLDQLAEAKLKVDEEITPEQIEHFKTLSEYGKLYYYTLEWVLARPRSIRETRDHLKQKQQSRLFAAKINNTSPQTSELGPLSQTSSKFSHKKTSFKKSGTPFPDEFIDQIITDLVAKKYLDDRNFTRFYLENRNATKGSSVKKLKLELTKKGVSHQLIEEFLPDLRNDAEEIQKIIAKKAHKYTKEKLIQYLLRQGFDFELVRSAVETDSQNLE